MATFFGEVQFPVSRACNEDEEVILDRYDFDICLEPVCDVKYKQLVVSYGTLANEYLKSCLNGKYTNIGSIQLKRSRVVEGIDTGDFHTKRLQPCFLYCNSDVLFCVASKDIASKIAMKLANVLFSLLNDVSDVLLLTSYHSTKLSNFESSNELCSTFSIFSTNYKGSRADAPPPLSPPAFLDSFPAAVLTKCEISGKSCATLCAFTENTEPFDVDLIVPSFRRFISKSPFKNDVVYNKKSTTCSSSDLVDRYL